MTSGNTEFNAEFNDTRLKIEIEVKIGEKKEIKNTFWRENLEQLQKIWHFHLRKFTEFEFKWQGQMQNSTLNSTIYDWRCKSNWKSGKKTEKDIWKRKFRRITQNLTRENSLNFNSNDTEKCRIERWIYWYSIEDWNRSENRVKRQRKKTFRRENLS